MMGDDELSDTIADMEPVEETEPPAPLKREEPDITFTEKHKMQAEALAEKRGEKPAEKRKRPSRGAALVKGFAGLVVLGAISAVAFNVFLNLGAKEKIDEACHHIPKNMEGVYETSLAASVFNQKNRVLEQKSTEALEKWCAAGKSRATPLAWNLGLTVPKPEGMDALEADIRAILQEAGPKCHANLTGWISRKAGVRGPQISTAARKVCNQFEESVNAEAIVSLPASNLWILAESLNEIHLAARSAKANIEAQRRMFGIE